MAYNQNALSKIVPVLSSSNTPNLPHHNWAKTKITHSVTATMTVEKWERLLNEEGKEGDVNRVWV